MGELSVNLHLCIYLLLDQICRFSAKRKCLHHLTYHTKLCTTYNIKRGALTRTTQQKYLFQAAELKVPSLSFIFN